MKRVIKSVFVVAICSITLCLGGCTKNGALTLVNTQEFDLDKYGQVMLDYDRDDVNILIGNENKIILQEYMTADKKAYYAKVMEANNSLQITEGQRPKSGGFKAKIDLTVPQGCEKGISIHTTDGSILSDKDLTVSSFKADTTRGLITLTNVNAANIDLSTTNGSINGSGLVAQSIVAKTTGGEINLSDLAAAGDFDASGDGKLVLSFREVTGNIKAFTKNSDLQLELPSDLSFKLIAESKNGTIKSDFIEDMASTSGSITKEVGGSSDINIEVETKNGDINVLKR